MSEFRPKKGLYLEKGIHPDGTPSVSFPGFRFTSPRVIDILPLQGRKKHLFPITFDSFPFLQLFTPGQYANY